jgi:transposase
MKGTLARLGIRNFKPTLRQAAERLATLHTPEGMPVPPNALAELHRDVARLGFVVGQIKQIEKARQKRLEQPESESGLQAKVRLLARVVGIGIETADMLVHVSFDDNHHYWAAHAASPQNSIGQGVHKFAKYPYPDITR